MSRLFWKIFFAFWVSLIVFSLSIIFTANHVIEHIRHEDSGGRYEQRIRAYVDLANQHAAETGIDGLREWFKTIDRKEVVPILLVNSQGEELLGRSVHQHMVRRVQRVIKKSQNKRKRFGPMPMGVVDVPDEGKYVMFPDIKSLSLSRVLHRPNILLLPLLIAMVASALVGIPLARYLTAPIARMRGATHRLAAGDFSHRVSPEIGSRRDEIAELAQDFDHMADRLQVLLASQRQLLSDVSHELRSPLARVQVALGLARLKSNGTATKELDRIEREAESLNKLIGQLLSLTRLEAEQYDSNTAVLDLNALLYGIVDDANFEAHERACVVELQESAMVSVDGNETLLKSAFENIVRNAVKYTREHSKVTVVLILIGETWCRIEINDEGPGVPEEKLASLFEPFVRVAEARDRDSGGFGLGLSIAERAIRIHGGSMTANNRREGGLQIAVELPIHSKS